MVLDSNAGRRLRGLGQIPRTAVSGVVFVFEADANGCAEEVKVTVSEREMSQNMCERRCVMCMGHEQTISIC